MLKKGGDYRKIIKIRGEVNDRAEVKPPPGKIPSFYGVYGIILD